MDELPFLALIMTAVGMCLRPVYAEDADDAFTQAQEYAMVNLDHIDGEVIWVEAWNDDLSAEISAVVDQLDRFEVSHEGREVN